MKRKFWLIRIQTSMIPFLLLVPLFVLSGCESRTGKEAPPAAPPRATAAPSSFADLIARVSPAVVNISTTSTVTIPGTPFYDFFGNIPGGPLEEFFGQLPEQMPERQMKQQSLGSGVIISADGYIVTNNHVVAKATDIKVKLADGKEFSAKVIGGDSKTDLALIKISSGSESLPTLGFGDSSKARVGDVVLAVGNPFGLEQTVTQGIISATGRAIGAGPYDDFLQTDAAINPGNSGGPLIDLNGAVVGINTAIFAGGQGLGFAIPSSMVKSVTDQLREKGKVVRGWLGAAIQPVSATIAQAFGMKEPRGALVSAVTEGGPAAKGGIKRGDIILSFDGKQVAQSDALPRLVAGTAVGKTVEVVVFRQGKELRLPVKVEEMKGEEGAARQEAGREPAVQDFGLTLDDLKPRWRQQFGLRDRSGVVILEVVQGSPAEQAGIRPGDLVKEVNRTPVATLAQVRQALSQTEKGRPLLLLMQREGNTYFVTLESQ